MKKDKDYKFEVSVSDEQYKSKQDASDAMESQKGKDGKEIKKRLKEKGLCSPHFRKVEVTAEELHQLLRKGHCVCHVFNNTPGKDYFLKNNKCLKHFLYANCICVDVDHTRVKDVREYLSKLENQPTIVHTTYSHMQIDPKTNENKGVRFRMIYVFDQKIEGVYRYRYYANCINNYILSRVRSENEDEYPENEREKLDLCNLEASQYFNGTYYDPVTKTDGDGNSMTKPIHYALPYIYSFEDFGATEEGYIEYLRNYCGYESKNKLHEIWIGNWLHILTGKKYKLVTEKVDDKETYHYEEITDEEVTVVPETTTEYPDIKWDFTVTEQEEQDDMKKTCSPWFKHIVYSKSITINDFKEVCATCPKYKLFIRTESDDWIDDKWQYVGDNFIQLDWHGLNIGSNRLSEIYWRATIRRLIKPDTCADELLLNALFDVVYTCNNVDNKITVDGLINQVENAMKLRLEDIPEIKQVKDRLAQMRIPKDGIIFKHGTDDIPTLRKNIRYQMIHDVCDPAKTDKENLSIIKDRLGIDISTKTLMRIRKEYGEMKYKQHI